MTQPRLLWINLQGADWALVQPLVDAGALPRLAALIEAGSIGKLFAGQSLRFPTAAMTLATGASPLRHRIVTPLVVDASGPVGARPAERCDLGVPPVWEHVAAAGVSCAAVGWPVSYPATGVDNLLVVSDSFADASGTAFETWPFDPQTVSDPDLHAVFADLRLHPGDVSAEMVLPFLDKPETIDSGSDERLVLLARALARTLTLHGAATWIAEHCTPDFLAVNVDLVDFLSATFLQYRAPRMGHVSRSDHARFANVVEGAYRTFDMMLATYLELAGEGARVVLTSDHGHQKGALRKRPAEMRGGKVHLAYRDPGILCAAGPGIPEDRLVFGALQTDVAPTLLALLGLALPPEMDGHPIADLTTHVPSERSEIPSAQGPATAPAPETVVPRLLAWTRAGYLPDLPGSRDATREMTVSMQLEALARLSITAGAHAKALAHLAELLDLAPGNINAHVLIAQSQIELGQAEDAATALDIAEGLGLDNAMLDFLRGRIAQSRGNAETAKAHFSRAAQKTEKTAEGSRLLASTGWAQLRLAAHDAASSSFEQALSIDGASTLALGGLGTVHLGRKRFTQALSYFQSALKGAQHQPKVHARRGFALLGLGRLGEARSAFETSLSLAPGLELAAEGVRQLDQISAGTAIEALLQNWRAAEMEA
ncbi:alkaline phosphatase family protein [uncultured Roseobacter sp.]|uniref:alkaline phosphatase family protein n=1 Tax=uncultured Roseobacter sp. TaxID=114847 RepID=UPI00262E48CD|nr:alkaline phosphatase family protein [uncultured Roseobacter sp.]